MLASSSSCTSSVANIGSPKPEKRQANSPLPPTPAVSPDIYSRVDKNHSRENSRGSITVAKNLEDMYAKVHKNKKKLDEDERSMNTSSNDRSYTPDTPYQKINDSHRQSWSSKGSFDENKSVEDMYNYSTDSDEGKNLKKRTEEHCYETLNKNKKSPNKSDPHEIGYEKIRDNWLSSDGPESLLSQDPGYEQLHHSRVSSESDPNYEILRPQRTSSLSSSVGYSTIPNNKSTLTVKEVPNEDGYSKINKRKKESGYEELCEASLDDGYSKINKMNNEPGYEELNNLDSDLSDGYSKINKPKNNQEVNNDLKLDYGYSKINKSKNKDSGYEELNNELKLDDGYSKINKIRKNKDSGYDELNNPDDPNYESMPSDCDYATVQQKSTESESDPNYESVKYLDVTLQDPPYERLHDDSQKSSDASEYEQISSKQGSHVTPDYERIKETGSKSSDNSEDRTISDSKFSNGTDDEDNRKEGNGNNNIIGKVSPVDVALVDVEEIIDNNDEHMYFHV